MNKPDGQGKWEVASGETDGVFMPVHVAMVGGTMVVDDPALGDFPLSEYNAQLTDPEWRRG